MSSALAPRAKPKAPAKSPPHPSASAAPPAAPPPSAPSVRSALATFAAVLLVYVFTLHPSLPGGDAGELINAAHLLGVAHPPGYPLYTLLAKLFTLLPFGSIAWRVNLASALTMAAAVAVLHAAVVRATADVTAGVVAAGLFAFAGRTWILATGAEVFALNTLFAALLLYLAIAYADARELRFAKLGALTLGLGLSNHHTLVFLGLPLVAWALWLGRPGTLRPRTLATLAGLFALGLAPYAYLPLAAAHPNAATWGDETTLAGFLRHLLRTEYGTFRLGGEAFSARGVFVEATLLYAKDVARETLGVGLGLAAIGLAAHLPGGKAWTPLRAPVAWSVAAFTLYLGLFHALTNLPLDRPLLVAVVARFWVQANLLVCAWAGLGFARLAPRLGRAARPAAVALVLVALGVRFPAQDQRGNTLLHRYAEVTLGPLPTGALVLTRGDVITNATRYLQLSEGARPDLVLLDLEMLTFPWMKPLVARLHPDVVIPGARYYPGEAGAYDVRRLIEVNLERRRVFLCGGWKDGDPSPEGAFELIPHGLCEEVVQKGAAKGWEDWATTAPSTLPELSPWPSALEDSSWEQVALRTVFDAVHRHALYALNQAIARGNDAAALRLSATLFDALLAKDPSPPAPALKNAGITYNRLAQHDPSAVTKMVAAWRRFLAAAPSDPDAASIRESLRPYDGR